MDGSSWAGTTFFFEQCSARNIDADDVVAQLPAVHQNKQSHVVRVGMDDYRISVKGGEIQSILRCKVLRSAAPRAPSRQCRAATRCKNSHGVSLSEHAATRAAERSVSRHNIAETLATPRRAGGKHTLNGVTVVVGTRRNEGQAVKTVWREMM